MKKPDHQIPQKKLPRMDAERRHQKRLKWQFLNLIFPTGRFCSLKHSYRNLDEAESILKQRHNSRDYRSQKNSRKLDDPFETEVQS